MDKLKYIALALAIMAIVAAGYGVVGPFPKYQKANTEWMEAGRYNNAPPVYGDPVWEAQMRAAQDKERELSQRRDELRNDSQMAVIESAIPAFLAFVLGLIALRDENKGLAIVAIVGSLVAGGLIGIMLAAGVF